MVLVNVKCTVSLSVGEDGSVMVSAEIPEERLMMLLPHMAAMVAPLVGVKTLLPAVGELTHVNTPLPLVEMTWPLVPSASGKVY